MARCTFTRSRSGETISLAIAPEACLQQAAPGCDCTPAIAYSDPSVQSSEIPITRLGSIAKTFLISPPSKCIHTQGELVKDAQIQRPTPAECLQWHPEKAILAVGWRSGEITVFNITEPNLFEQSNVHKKALVFLVWNSTGMRLISGDKVNAENTVLY